MPHRPTTLQLFLNHCPRAVDHYDYGIPYDRDIFAEGTAAHEVLHALAEGRDVERVCVDLMSAGRTWEVDAEAPLPAERVLAGRDLALRWAEVHPLPTAATVDGEVYFEHRFAFRRDWTPCAWDDADCWIRTRIDVVIVAEEGDEEWSGKVVRVRDYKSSWQAYGDADGDLGELDTLQRKFQAVAAALAFPDAAILVAEVANLRRLRIDERRIPLDDEGRALLAKWRRDIELVAEALDHKPRVARPGVGCVACPYVRHCDDARAFLAVDPETPDAVVRAWWVSRGTTEALELLVRRLCADGSLEVDGQRVGFVGKARRYVRDGFGFTALRWFLDELGVDVDEGLGNALASWFARVGEPGVTAAEKIAKALFSRRDQKAERDAWLAGFTDAEVQAQFGWGPIETTVAAPPKPRARPAPTADAPSAPSAPTRPPAPPPPVSTFSTDDTGGLL